MIAPAQFASPTPACGSNLQSAEQSTGGMMSFSRHTNENAAMNA
jgi:hypothetical protein